jgi:hypothetical protein
VAAAFVPGVPLALLATPAAALAWARAPRERALIALAASLALWLPALAALLDYGVAGPGPLVAAAAIMSAHVLLLTALPPLVSLPLLALSPFAFGHPWLGVMAAVPGATAIPGWLIASLLLMLLGIRKLALPALLTILALSGMPGSGGIAAAWDWTSTRRLEAVETDLGTPAALPITDWSRIAAAVPDVPLGTSAAPPLVFPEGSIHRDTERADRFFVTLAGRLGRVLLIPVDREQGEQAIRVFNSEGAPFDVYRQVQGVPLVKHGLADPRDHFEQSGWRLPDGGLVRFMICYEAFLPLPWLAALTAGADVVAIATNDAWDRRGISLLPREKLTSAMRVHAEIALATNRRPDDGF